MPKQKTHKGLKKRVKVTGRGKVRRHKAGKGHLLSSKTGKRRRHLRQPAGMIPAEEKRALDALCL